MAIPDTEKPERHPIHPGEILREAFLPDFGLTAATPAKALGVSRQSVYELIGERRAVSPEMALGLSRLLGNTAEFWLDLQRDVDLWEASASIEDGLRRIVPLAAEYQSAVTRSACKERRR